MAILGWIVGAPAYRHLLEGRNPHARAWMMFAGIGLGGIDVRFHVRGEDGTLVEVDRWEATGREMPERISARRIKNRKALDSEIRRLCRALGPDADLRVSARQAVRGKGWTWIDQGDVDVCTSPGKRRKQERR